jgi:ABC-type transport system involved in cytochrome c biogenesis permease component
MRYRILDFIGQRPKTSALLALVLSPVLIPWLIFAVVGAALLTGVELILGGA